MKRNIVLLALLACVARNATAGTITEVHYVMGTYLRITADDADVEHARAAVRGCFATARHFDRLFSRFDPTSELSQLNATTESTPTIPVSNEMAAVLRRALQLQTATNRTFDVAVGGLTRLWRGSEQWPAPAAVKAALQTAQAGALELRRHTLIRRPGVVIDLDGIAKGWAVDDCVTHLRAAGIGSAFVNFGESSLYALGAPGGARDWEVMLRGLDADATLGNLELRDQAVSVSGVFGHARRIGKTRIGHIIDPRSGQPLTSPAMAVVVAASATDAEAFSKALLILSAATPVRSLRPVSAIAGALLIRAGDIQRVGQIAFTPFAAPHPLPASAELLR